MTLHTQLADIAADHTWSPVYRAEALRALAELPDGPALPDGSARNLLHGRVAGRRTQPASLDDIDRLRARFARCCDMHNTHCEPPSELCCNGCTEVRHPEHRRGARCVLDAVAGRD